MIDSGSLVLPATCARFTGRIFLEAATDSVGALDALESLVAHWERLGHPAEDAAVLAVISCMAELPRWSPSAEGPIGSIGHNTDHRPTPLALQTARRHCRGPYPIVATAEELEAVLRAGVSIAQLRFKGDAAQRRDQIHEAMEIERQFPQSLVVINDHWAEALAAGARAIHLGQEDIAEADLSAIHRAGVSLGISTHSPVEVCRALWAGASMVAVGPIFPTYAKAMPWRPQGLTNLAFWRRWVDLPLIGIGGLALDHCDAIANTGADAIAVIGAIAGTPDPERAATEFCQRWDAAQALRAPSPTLDL